MRLAIVILLLFPAIALGQAKEKDEDKVSNDQPDRPHPDAAGNHRGQRGDRRL